MSNNHPYESHNSQYGVRISYLLSDGKKHEESIAVVGYHALRKKCDRHPAFRLKEGRGKGNEALVRWGMLPAEWQKQLTDKWGHPDTHLSTSTWQEYYEKDTKAAEYYAAYRLPDGRALPDDLAVEYTNNASALNTAIKLLIIRREYRKKAGGSTAPVWDIVKNDVEAHRQECGHTLKTASLRRIVREYKAKGYESLISGKLCNQNTAKVKTDKQATTIEELIKKHNNLDNAQVADIYNTIAARLGWKTITSGTIANYRKETNLYTYSGRRGVTNFRNKMAMQVKRLAPSRPMLYWTLDGWDVELLYQQRTTDRQGRNVTTYHNRPTVVVVLDPCCKYPIGYAVGTHETPDLIREALRNATNHAQQLFGARYKPLQLQSDRYGNGALTPLYESMTKHYTPARVKNAKSKVVEPYFRLLNRKIQYLPNWSGYNITSNRELQPNDEYLNKIRHQFPDYQGCVEQVVRIMEVERAAKYEQYMELWQKLPPADRLTLPTEDYLYLFGETTGFTNRLQGHGIEPTILGEKISYDCFDVRFRELSHIDWIVKYDPEDLTYALAVNAEKKKGEVNEIGTYRFLLEAKHLQPMALYDRKEGDAEQLARVNRFNDQLEETVVERTSRNRSVLEELFAEHPELDGTLAKLMLVDSRGQHKDRRNVGRGQRAESGEKRVKQIELPQPKEEEPYEIIFDPVAAARAQY